VRLALACLVLLQAAAANAHVYGIDRRAQRDADVLPYRAVGMLVDPHTGNGGTAFLVGRCHVVSAHHVPYDAGARQEAANPPGLGRQVRFLVGPRPGKARVFASSTTATVVDAGRFVQDDFAGAAGDWAILRLDNCLGDRYGWLRVDRDTTPEGLPGTTLTSVGYPRSRSRQPGVTIESGCRARDFGPVPASSASIAGSRLACRADRCSCAIPRACGTWSA
jgi:V8-like Glu-specific endopeptidase